MSADRLTHLAQVNIGTLVAPLDDPRIDDFRNALDEVNALAELAPGFVWRLQTEEGNATAIQAFPDPLTIVNLSVWESPAALRAFVFDGLHRAFLRRRREWFVAAERTTALWWIPAGTQPTVDDAKARLAFLATYGDSPYAFGLQRTHPVLTIEPTGDHAGNCDAGDRVQLRAELDGVAVGRGGYRVLDHVTAEIDELEVDPEHRRAKLGAAILANIEHRARGAGVKRLVVACPGDSSAGLGLWARAGFVPTGPWAEHVDTTGLACFDKPL